MFATNDHTAQFLQTTEFTSGDSTSSRLVILGTEVAIGPASKYGYPFHTTAVKEWQSEKPPLTVPDLADSLEALLARRSAGIAGVGPTMSLRSFPTDPATIKTAGEMLREVRENAKMQLESAKLQIEARRIERAEKQVQDEKQRADFAAFLASKSTKGDGIINP